MIKKKDEIPDSKQGKFSSHESQLSILLIVYWLLLLRGNKSPFQKGGR